MKQFIRRILLSIYVAIRNLWWQIKLEPNQYYWLTLHNQNYTSKQTRMMRWDGKQFHFGLRPMDHTFIEDPQPRSPHASHHNRDGGLYA